MAVVALLTLGFLAFLIIRTSTPNYALLYSGLAMEDSSAIIEELQKQNIPYELRGDGDTILVPREQITQLRMSLASSGLPNHGQVGYEIFDSQSSLGATSFVQNINNVRALEGELARTIGSLNRIKSARVHLVLPERALFSREQKEPTASIVVSVRGELSGGEIRAIQHLTAAAIEGLTPARVAIVDDTGRLLASGSGNGPDDILSAETEERTLNVETRFRNRVEELLSNVVGVGRARVQVSAQLDLQNTTWTSESYDPNGQVVRSTQTRELANSSKAPADNAQVSVSTQLPGTPTDAANGASTEQGSTQEETTNYEISKTTETRRTDSGGIKRLSIAVVVDGTYSTDADGKLVYAARDQAELDQLTALVKSAVGFDENRGDLVQVTNLQFADQPATGPGTAAAGLFDFSREDLMNIAEMVVTLAIALALMLFVLRPLLRRVLTPEDKPLALPPQAQVPVPTVDEAGVVQPAPPWITDAVQESSKHSAAVKTVGELVTQNPHQAALVVRDWLSGSM
jgi:flagellar M-ring protein FliF